jgi:hypothetical protein
MGILQRDKKEGDRRNKLDQNGFGIILAVLPPRELVIFIKTSCRVGKLAAHHLPALCRIKFFEMEMIVSN